MILGVDHIAIAVADPDAGIEALAGLLGVPAGAGGRHSAWGTRNRLLWLGDSFVELYTVDDPVLAQGAWLGRPALAALPGPAMIGWALASDDLDTDLQAMNDHGATLGPPTPGERRRPDGRIVRWRQSLPSDVSLDRPFLIEHDASAAEWSAADRAERAAAPGRLTVLELPIDAIQGFAPDRGQQFGRQTVRLTGASAGLPTVHVAGLTRRAPTSMVGCRWLFD